MHNYQLLKGVQAELLRTADSSRSRRRPGNTESSRTNQDDGTRLRNRLAGAFAPSVTTPMDVLRGP